MPASPPADAAALAEVRGAILTWYRANHRWFPWRGTTDPWAVLVSEVMLQQTQASRVAARFPPFLRRFPTARAMAASTEADVLAAWSGLGYNRRALTLHRAARSVTRAGWPTDVAELERLPGIGPYTARAVAALAFGQPVGAVDTNVRRWLARRFRTQADRPRQLQ
ncbi:MAG TPA: A/G-specific adenine glycosylase, partial [Candidatus Limnocylindria bacterium]|nr:A/G-specific adenine glycosylase [Candidatus Limnocylindria bacterium]